MQSSRWGRVALGLIGSALPLALLVALSSNGWPEVAAWLLALLVGSGVLALGLHERESARMQRAFATGLGHDLRTPLAHIRTFNEMLLLDQVHSPEEREEWLHIVGREAQRLGDLLENFLFVAQSPQLQESPARRATDLGALLEDVAAFYTGYASARGMRIAANPPGGIVAAVDPRAVRQAVVNLVENAIRYGPEGQTITLDLERREDGRAVVSVADRGPGIAPRHRARVWKPFSRVPHPNGGEQGSGLGLAVVSRIAELHGGSISIEDAPGGGSRFCMALPVLASASSASARPVGAATPL